MKTWDTKRVNFWNLNSELNAYSSQGWEIFKVTYLGEFGTEAYYSIIAYYDDSQIVNKNIKAPSYDKIQEIL
jgi:hypothetical protein